MNNILSMP